MDSLLRISPVTNPNDKRIKTLYDQTEIDVWRLQALGVHAESVDFSFDGKVS